MSNRQLPRGLSGQVARFKELSGTTIPIVLHITPKYFPLGVHPAIHPQIVIQITLYNKD
jgi:hypothetical protein